MDEEIDLGLQVEHGIRQIRNLVLHVQLPNPLDGLLHLLDLPIGFVGLGSGGVELLPQLVDLLENGGEIGRRRHRSCFDLEPGEMGVDWIQDWITEVEVDLGSG